MSEPDFEAIARKHGATVFTRGPHNVVVPDSMAIAREAYALGKKDGTADGLRKAAEIALDHPYPAHDSSGGMIANEIRTEADKWSR